MEPFLPLSVAFSVWRQRLSQSYASGARWFFSILRLFNIRIVRGNEELSSLHGLTIVATDFLCPAELAILE